MKLKRIISILLTVLLLFTLCSCGKDKTSSDEIFGAQSELIDSTPAARRFNLLYCSKDALNPYTATTKVNQELCLLMFDSLYKLDNNFKLINEIAKSYKADGKEITVSIKSSLKFSDASLLTPEDVVFSFSEAKKSANYNLTLASVVSCVKVSNDSIKFTFSKQDAFGINLLTFPILKAGSTNRVDGDNVALPPIGSGKYVFDSKQGCLIVNSFCKLFNPNIKRIYLTNAPDNEVVEHNIKVGYSDIYYNSTADEKTIRMNNAERKYLNTTNLVYLGANTKSGVASNSYVRYAVSAALDRAAVSKQSYYAAAVPATGIFHPDFEPAKAYQTIQTSPKKEISVVNLEQIGYNRIDNEGFYINKSGKRLNISVLVNSDNESRLAAAELIVASLRNAGINASLKTATYSKYVAMLSAGQFDFYLGEINFTPNMDISALVYPGGSVAYGIADKTPVVQSTSSEEETTADISLSVWQILDRFYEGNATVADIVNIFESELPVIPVCYRYASLFYNKNFSSAPQGSVSDIFLGIENYAFKEEIK